MNLENRRTFFIKHPLEYALFLDDNMHEESK